MPAYQLHDPAKAYAIVEQVGGCAITDLLLAGSITNGRGHEGTADPLSTSMKLMSARSAAETRKIRNQIFLVEQARWVTPDIHILTAESHKTIGMDQVQHALGPSSAILEYVMAEPQCDAALKQLHLKFVSLPPFSGFLRIASSCEGAMGPRMFCQMVRSSRE